MAVDNSIGSVYVDIRGDYSRLQADFAGAQALATKAGAGIATGLTGGMGPAVAGASLIVDKFGKNFTEGFTVPVEAAKPAVLDLTGGIQRLIIAQALLEQATAGTVPALEAQNAAMAHSVSQIQATSGAIRVLEGSQGIRAVERFLVSIPGVGAALQSAFPLIGAIALFEMISRIVGKLGELTEAEKKVAEVTKQTDDEFKRLGTELEHIRIEELVIEFGKLAGLPVKEFFDVSNIRDANAAIDQQTGKIGLANEQLEQTNSLYAQAYSITSLLQMFNPLIVGERIKEMWDLGSSKDQEENIRGLNRQLDVMRDKVRNLTAQKDLDAKNDAKLRAEESGALGGARIAAEIAAGEHLAAQQKAWTEDKIAQDHHDQEMRILGITDTGTRSVAEAEEELRVARANQAAVTAALATEVPKRIALIREAGAAEAEGKTPPEQKRIGIQTETKVGDFQAQSDQKSIDASKAAKAALYKLEEANVTATKGWAEQVTREWEKSFEARRKDAERTFASENIGIANAILGAQAASEVMAKSKGETDALATQRKKIELEGQYALAVTHSGAQQVAFAVEVARLDRRARADKIAGLNERMASEAATMHPAGDPKSVEETKHIAELWAQIEDLKAKGDNDDVAAQNQIKKLIEEQTIQYKLRADFNRALQQTPGAIGGAVARGVFDGKGIGQDIRNAMKGVGEQLMGAVIRDLIVKMGEEIAAHTIIGAIMTWLGGTQAATAAAQVTAVSANTVALAANTVALGASSATSAAGGVAGGVGSAAGGIAGAAGGAASSAATGLMGPLIAAAGGIIGGVISGVMSLIGAHQIVTAIHGTTAAVQALHGTVSGTGGPVTSGVPSTPAATTTGGASQGGLTGFFASILGLGGAKPIDVNIVGISPLSPLKGLFNLFGFASGGRPPVGIASIVGENGPEMFIPDSAGQIVPAGKFGGTGLSMPSSSSSVTSQSTNMNNTFHVYGVQNARDLVRQIPTLLKSTWPGYAPASR